VMACGVAMVIMSLSTLDSLERTRGDYYERHGFPDVFAPVKRAPNSLVARLAVLPGVAHVEARVVATVSLDVRGLSEPATGRLISLPDSGSPRLNTLHLRQGRLLDPGRTGEVLLAEAFAAAHHLEPGDSLRAVINGRLKELRVVGVVLSPEYIYSVRPGEILPDDKRFGVLWMGYRELSAAFDLDGAFNDLVVKLRSGASEADVIQRIDRMLGPHGGIGAHGRADQASYRFLENEMIQLRAMASLPPLIFLSVTSFLMQVVFSRLVATQREQIATLRAFGYTRGEIGRHFLLFAAVITAVGTIGGIALGMQLGYDLTVLYVRFFRFPTLQYQLDPLIALLAATVSALSALFGVWSAVWRAVREPPAQAMQPEAPARFHASLLEGWGLRRLLSPTSRMILRNIERQPLRTAFSSLGIALAIGILVLGNFTEDTVDHVMNIQFNEVARQDMMVSFVEPTSAAARHNLSQLPGVLTVEPYRVAPARLRFGSKSRRLAIMGLDSPARLYRPLEAAQRPVALPDDGLVISRKLAEVLACERGDVLRVEVLEQARPVRHVAVREIIDDYLELNAYMNRKALHRLLREQDAISGAFLAVDDNQTDRLYRELKAIPRVAGVTVQRFALESYRRTLAENILRMKAINVFFASVVALGVVYNGARVTLAERSRELASLRVLGFTRGEISRILFGELTLVVLLAIPLGCVVGYLFASILTASLNTEVHRFPLLVRRETYLFATSVTVVAACLSGLAVRHRLHRLDLVSVLKARD